MRKQLPWLALTFVFAAISAIAAAEESQEASSARWNVIKMGAVADGTTDDTAAFQKALDAAGHAGGGIVEAPAGRFRIGGTLVVPRGVTLQGTYRVPPTAHAMTGKPDGTVLQAYAGRGSDKGPPFIRLAGDNAAIAGLVIIYPEWSRRTCRRFPIRLAWHRMTPTTSASRNAAC
jgi:hypothetical protein